MSAGTARYPAPAVEYPVGRSRTLAAVLVALKLSSLAVVVAWLRQGAGAGAELRVLIPAVLLWLVAAALALRFWWRLPVGKLAWDGAGWQLRCAGGTPFEQALGGAIVVQLDLQGHMALAFPGARPVSWLLVERNRAPVRWLDLRRAVYSRPSAAEPAAAGAPHEGPSS